MNDNRNSETISDIINEIRRDPTPYSIKVAVELEEQTTGNRVLLQDAATCLRDDEHYIKELADRLEAAEKREHGNAAAMQDALAKIRRELNDYCDGCTLLDRMTENPPDYTCLRDSLLEIERIAEAALSAPPRNCDRFADELDAQLAFLNEVWLISVDRETMLERDKYENWSDEMRASYGGWLLTPAAVPKGDGDGK